MRMYVVTQEAIGSRALEELADEFEGLVPEFVRCFLLSQPEESDEQRASRTAVIREVFAEIRGRDLADELTWLAAYHALQFSLTRLVKAQGNASAAQAFQVRKAA